jgi:hypothetical protein
VVVVVVVEVLVVGTGVVVVVDVLVLGSGVVVVVVVVVVVGAHEINTYRPLLPHEESV